MSTGSLEVHAPEEKIRRLEDLYVQRRAKAKRVLGLYYSDPVAFIHDCITWPEGESAAPYQEEALAAIPEHKKVCVRSLHGVGKTTNAALAILWFALTRDAAAVDWKCPTTAGAWRQLEQYLWPEVHKWARCLNWDRLSRDPFARGELLRQNLNLRFGSAFAVASDVPAYIEGVHADSVLYVFDEAKAIIPGTFDAAEGAFTGAEGTEAFALAQSTPGEPVGRFYDICTHKAGLEDWHPIHVTLDVALKSGRVGEHWVEQRKLQWGENSAVFANRVLGEFHSSDEDNIIPLSWVEAAVERWKVTQDRLRSEVVLGRPRSLEPKQIEALVRERDLASVNRVGCDVARTGEDKTCMALIAGERVCEIRTTFHELTNETSGRLAGVLEAHKGHEADAVVDTDGLGAGVTDSVREQGYTVHAFHAQERTDLKDRSGELGFTSVKAAAWWTLRERLDPAFDPVIELPDDPLLLGDLTAPKWKPPNSRSQIGIENKDEVKKRLGRSPDAGDAVVMGLWTPRKRRKRRMVGPIRESPPVGVR